MIIQMTDEGDKMMRIYHNVICFFPFFFPKSPFFFFSFSFFSPFSFLSFSFLCLFLFKFLFFSFLLFFLSFLAPPRRRYCSARARAQKYVSIYRFCLLMSSAARAPWKIARERRAQRRNAVMDRDEMMIRARARAPHAANARMPRKRTRAAVKRKNAKRKRNENAKACAKAYVERER